MDKNNKTWCLYKHTNIINGKVYIGITKFGNSPSKRWGKNGNRYNTQFFGKAIHKYGWDNFEHEILFENLTEIEAKQKEIELIKFYDSSNLKKGYNLTKGGDGSLGLFPNEETRIKQSISAMNRNDFKKVICLETLDIFKNCSRCAEILKVDPSCISRMCNKNKNRTKTVKNLHFAYLEDYKEEENNYYIPNKTLKELIKENKNIPVNSIEFICLETKDIFKSGTFVKNWLGIKHFVNATIEHPRTNLNINDGKRYHITPLYYYNTLNDKDINYIINYLDSEERKEKYVTNSKKCIDLLDMKIYDSCAEYSRHYNINSSSGRKRCIKGKVAMWYEDYLKKIGETQNE